MTGCKATYARNNAGAASGNDEAGNCGPSTLGEVYFVRGLLTEPKLNRLRFQAPSSNQQYLAEAVQSGFNLTSSILSPMLALCLNVTRSLCIM